YDAAREDQARNESRISEIEQILAVAKIAEGDSMSVSIGSKVEIEDERGKRLTFQIVGTTQTDSLNHLISNESPAGKAMIGHVAGDKVSFTTPSGKVREYTITSIEV
ncbi:MAG: GreA/GreB family elongation factor, partial [Atopobiaceae bacterium]|nr:GreA/GreB family elongation factor [Atopobiaceae bacterium]